jgi:hypothetical protein
MARDAPPQSFNLPVACAIGPNNERRTFAHRGSDGRQSRRLEVESRLMVSMPAFFLKLNLDVTIHCVAKAARFA